MIQLQKNPHSVNTFILERLYYMYYCYMTHYWKFAACTLLFYIVNYL